MQFGSQRRARNRQTPYGMFDINLIMFPSYSILVQALFRSIHINDGSSEDSFCVGGKSSSNISDREVDLSLSELRLSHLSTEEIRDSLSDIPSLVNQQQENQAREEAAILFTSGMNN